MKKLFLISFILLFLMDWLSAAGTKTGIVFTFGENVSDYNQNLPIRFGLGVEFKVYKKILGEVSYFIEPGYFKHEPFSFAHGISFLLGYRLGISKKIDFFGKVGLSYIYSQYQRIHPEQTYYDIYNWKDWTYHLKGGLSYAASDQIELLLGLEYQGTNKDSVIFTGLKFNL